MTVNAFFVIALVALVLEYLVGLTANLLNLKSLRAEAPVALADLYEPQEYVKSQEYTRATTRMEFVTGSISLMVLLGFWFTGGFNYLDETIRGWGLPTLVDGVLYIGILAVAYLVLSLPFSVYSTFVIEERFGFNKTTPVTFAADRAKGLALAALLGIPLLVGILAFFEYAGALAWLYAWIAVALFGLAVQFVAPTWIMPIFNKFTPMEAGELKDAILDYARSVDFGVDTIFVIDGSKRSSKANAFFTGFGRRKRIALFDTLVEKHAVPEMVAVLAHEIGHYKRKHILQRMAIGVFQSGVLFFLLSIFLDSGGLYDAFGMEQSSIYAGLLFFGLLYTPIDMVLSAVMQALSRKHEYEADSWAAETVEEPQSLVLGLKRLSTDNLSNLAPHPLYVFLNYSHPPLLQRVQAIERSRSRTSA